MKILVADDDAVSRMLMQRMLRQMGFETTVATNGTEAVEILSQDNGPRLVLLDWTMPGLDGPEVCRVIRGGARNAYVYITLLTSKESKEDLVAGLGAGADDYLTKPCHPEELRARLHTGQRILQLEDILVGAREEMRLQATHDALTQLLNRRAIFDVFAAKLSNARLRLAEFSLMLCDVDHFKQINDKHGHLVGDEVLREVANRLKASVRKGAVGRYGGEEFMLLLEGCGSEFLQTVSNRICAMICSAPIKTSVGPLSVTISAGTVVVDDERCRLSLENIVQQADALLYQAKRQGRNQALVAVSRPPTAASTHLKSVMESVPG